MSARCTSSPARASTWCSFHKQLVIESKDIVGLLKPENATQQNVIEMQLEGASYEVTIENGFDEACMLIGRRASGKSLVAESADSRAGRRRWHGAVHRDARADRDGAARLAEAEAPAVDLTSRRTGSSS